MVTSCFSTKTSTTNRILGIFRMGKQLRKLSAPIYGKRLRNIQSDLEQV